MALRSGIAWLSSSSAEITRARGVLDALRKPGVIDELGFLMLNGAFAERLYPGVTTIMTRARYLIFIPAIYRFLEQSRKGVGKDVDRIARDLQFALRNALEKTETSFIGRDSGARLVRTPSTVYWTSLEALRLATRRISEASYQRQLSEGLFGTRVHKDDDDAAHDDDVESLWTSELRLGHVFSNGEFPATTSFLLRKSEATLLAARYAALTPGGYENLVTRMVSLGQQHGAASLEHIDFPWDVPVGEPALAALMEHARRLSLLARGATLQYYRMLIEKRQEVDPGIDSAFVDWWEHARPELGSWDLPGFFRLMALWEAGRGFKDQQFISSWSERMGIARDGQAALVDRQAREIIARRENYVRPGKQRLKVKHQLESWRPPDGFSSGLYYMDYRHRVGRQIAMDIVEGLERGAA